MMIFGEITFLKAYALEIAFLRFHIAKIIGLSKGFLSFLVVFERLA